MGQRTHSDTILQEMLEMGDQIREERSRIEELRRRSDPVNRQDPQYPRLRHRLRAAVDAKLAIDAARVPLDGLG